MKGDDRKTLDVMKGDRETLEVKGDNIKTLVRKDKVNTYVSHHVSHYIM